MLGSSESKMVGSIPTRLPDDPDFAAYFLAHSGPNADYHVTLYGRLYLAFRAGKRAALAPSSRPAEPEKPSEDEREALIDAFEGMEVQGIDCTHLLGTNIATRLADKALAAGFHRTEKPQAEVERLRSVIANAVGAHKDGADNGDVIAILTSEVTVEQAVAAFDALAEKPQADHAALIAEAREKPKVVTLSGSRKRAGRAFIEHDSRLTLEGCIVLSIDDPTNAECATGRPEAVKAKLDELHFRKIDLSDEVLVLNVGGYIGSSTRNEIAYAEKVGVPVRYLEPLADALEGKETQQP